MRLFILHLSLIVYFLSHPVKSYEDCKSLKYIGDPCKNGTARYMCYSSIPICAKCLRGQYWNPVKKQCENCKGILTSCEENVLTTACSNMDCEDADLFQGEDEGHVLTQTKEISKTVKQTPTDFEALFTTVESGNTAATNENESTHITKENATDSFLPPSNKSDVMISTNATNNGALEFVAEAEIRIPIWCIILLIFMVLMIVTCATSCCIRRRKTDRESEKNDPECQNLHPNARRELDDQQDVNQPINAADLTLSTNESRA